MKYRYINCFRKSKRDNAVLVSIHNYADNEQETTYLQIEHKKEFEIYRDDDNIGVWKLKKWKCNIKP